MTSVEIARKLFNKALSTRFAPTLKKEGFRRERTNFIRRDEEEGITERLTMAFHARPTPSIEVSFCLGWNVIDFVIRGFHNSVQDNACHLSASLGDMMGSGWTEIRISPNDSVESLATDLVNTWVSVVTPWAREHRDLSAAAHEWESFSRTARYNAQWYGPAAVLAVRGRAGAIELAEAYRSLARTGELQWHAAEFEDYERFISSLREVDVDL